MAWSDLPLGMRNLIEQTCTPAEADVIRRVSDGKGLGTVARERGVKKGTVQVLYRRGFAKVEAAILQRRVT